MYRHFIRDAVQVFSFAFVISVILTPIIRRICRKRNLYDLPNDERRIHTIPIPRLGGIAIYAAFFGTLFIGLFSPGALHELFAYHGKTLFSLFISSSIVFGIGVYDDIRGATIPQKFVVQVAAAIAIYTLGFKITIISMPFIGSVSLEMLSLPLTVFWIVGVTNAINFIDGMDGLASGVGFFYVSTMFLLSLFLGNGMTALFSAMLAGAISGFLCYNFSPASIFMGDSGSLFIGFMIATIALQGSQKSSTAVVLLIPIVALGLPITDTILAVTRRLSHGRSPFSADREHIHHRLLNMGLSPRKTVLMLYGVCFLLGVTALLMTAVNNQVLTLILIVLSIMAISGIRMLGYTSSMIEINELVKQRIRKKRRLLEQQRLTKEILNEMQSISDIPTLKKIAIRAFEVMEFDIGYCTFASSKTFDIKDDCHWRSPRYERREIPHDLLATITVPLLCQEKKSGELMIGKFFEPADVGAFFEMSVLVEQLKSAFEQQLPHVINQN
ncbi:UDP-N-acetylmuramyl pentapeptide phosphotransferase/UDP-N-acetylglucosamine-1-phosphate [Candidatus Moduliflexus flocculans]|uniref:UDP-N-acetylmuramyl pentapeptide phosphotransferase/UDP-N-acetylglucosamine-1-phosphate n=1 Tax=Candidatus Moduliflexus flocculans TaxID=1499966 RepID=A0A081BND6_9BACT|nr:UDP-N-acetylmuramyl pentapeptide phosphotransferase/UDP-N-acetylglucosamine-1-phosphate [Candidatus Moduliflexus flocculans]